MKQLFIILVLTAAAMSASAKIIVTGTDNTGNERKSGSNSLFRNTKIELSNNKIAFDHLPKNTTDYYVLDSSGHARHSGTLSRANNTPKLPKGAFTIILKQGTSTKIFGWLKEAVVKG